jgi:hypothetical protein
MQGLGSRVFGTRYGARGTAQAQNGVHKKGVTAGGAYGHTSETTN